VLKYVAAAAHTLSSSIGTTATERHLSTAPVNNNKLTAVVGRGDRLDVVVVLSTTQMSRRLNAAATICTRRPPI